MFLSGLCVRPEDHCRNIAREERGSILDAIKDPTLSAEITLQPIRRYGVDAAILFSDIIVPVHAVGFGIDIKPVSVR